jgi:hypothetical protein
MIRMRFFALQAMRSLGYEIRRVADPAKLDIEPVGTDPVTLEYCLTKRGYAVLDIPLESCRAFHTLGLPLNPRDHPFVKAFQAALPNPRSEGALADIRQVLEQYYDAVQPASACEVVGLSPQLAPGLRGVAPLGYIYPWSEKGVDEITQRRKRSMKYVGMRYGFKPETEIGHTFFGPARAAKLELQIARLHTLMQAVRSQGFKPFARDFPTKVIALRKDSENRWLIEEGQHRFAIGAALTIASIPAIVTSVVRREDARLWPQVVSGTFTEEGALNMFDRIFGGVPPPVARDWAL